MLVIRSVTEADTGQYLCTVQTYPPHNIIVRVTVTGEAASSQQDYTRTFFFLVLLGCLSELMGGSVSKGP